MGLAWLAEEPAAPTVEPLLPPPADDPPVPTVDAEPEPEPAAEPPVPTLELLLPPPAEVPPVPSVDAEPLPEPAAEPAVPTLELLVPPPADVPPVPIVDADPLPDPADEPPVPTLELLVPPPADVPPVPMVELDCAIASAVLASNAATIAEVFRTLIGISSQIFKSGKNYADVNPGNSIMFLDVVSVACISRIAALMGTLGNSIAGQSCVCTTMRKRERIK
jgi:hypothetical protein